MKYRRTYFYLDTKIQGEYLSQYYLPFGQEINILHVDREGLCKIKFTRNKFSRSIARSLLTGIETGEKHTNRKRYVDLICYARMTQLCVATKENRIKVQEIRNHKFQVSRLIKTIKVVKGDDPYLVKDNSRSLSNSGQHYLKYRGAN